MLWDWGGFFLGPTTSLSPRFPHVTKNWVLDARPAPSKIGIGFLPFGRGGPGREGVRGEGGERERGGKGEGGKYIVLGSIFYVRGGKKGGFMKYREVCVKGEDGEKGRWGLGDG